MSYTELESGYQGLKQRPGFYVGHDGNLIALVSDPFIFNFTNIREHHINDTCAVVSHFIEFL